MAVAGEFDVEAVDGDDGEVDVKPASPQEPAAPVEEKRKPGRPRKEPAAASAVATPASPARASLLSGAPPAGGPKDARDLWLAILDEAREAGRVADEFIIYVYRLQGPQIDPIRMQERIYGEQVSGDPDNGINPGDALIDFLTDNFHMLMTTTAAKYRLEFCWKSDGRKIRMSDPWPLDAPSQIEKLRRRMQVVAERQPGVSGYSQPSIRRANLQPQWPHPYMPPPPPPPPVADPAPAPASMAAPQQPTGDPWLDRLIAMQEDQRQRDHADAQRREEELKLRLEASDRRFEEMRLQLLEQRQQPQVVAGPPASPQPVESDDVKQAKMAAMISQSVMQTLIAAGVVKPPGQEPPPPTTSDAQRATGTLRDSADTMESFIDQMERMEKMKGKMRKAFGLPEKDEPEEEEEEEEEDTEKVPMLDFNGFKIPKKFTKDAGNMKKLIEIGQSNPALLKEILTSMAGAVASRLDMSQIAGLLGAAVKNPAAAGLLQAAANGASGGFKPPTA